MTDGGKGSNRRRGADDKRYAEGWDRIFGNKENVVEDSQQEIEEGTEDES